MRTIYVIKLAIPFVRAASQLSRQLNAALVYKQIPLSVSVAAFLGYLFGCCQPLLMPSGMNLMSSSCHFCVGPKYATNAFLMRKARGKGEWRVAGWEAKTRARRADVVRQLNSATGIQAAGLSGSRGLHPHKHEPESEIQNMQSVGSTT